MWRNEGLGGFYSSYGSNYAYSTPVDAIKFLLYELGSCILYEPEVAFS